MTKRILGVVCAVVTAMGLAAPAAAESKVELKLAFWVPAKHPLHPTGFVPWGESITKASGGSITFAYFPSQQLGKAKDHYDMARDGIADITFVNPGYTPGRFPVAAAGELPFQIANAKAGSRAFDEWYRAYAAKEMGDVKVCMTFLHDPGTLHAKQRISSPDQIKGMKIRPAHATMARFVNELGGASVQVSAPEARDALAKGTADAITFPWNSIYLFGIDKVTKFHLDMPFYVTTFALVMNQAKYDSMSAAQKKVIDEHCTSEWAERVAAGWADWEAAGRKKFIEEAGQNVYPPTAAEVAAWRKAAEPLYAAWAKDVSAKGLDPDKVFGALRDALKKHNALYE